MLSSFEKFFESDVLPFFSEFSSVGSMASDALNYTFVFIVAAFAGLWFEKMVIARARLYPVRGIFRLLASVVLTAAKKSPVPKRSQTNLYVWAPLFAFAFALFFAFFMPVGSRNIPPEFGMLYLLFAASFGMYTFILGGWSGGSRFSFFGAVRLLAQTVSCQTVLGIVVLTILMTAGVPDMQGVMAAQKGMWFIFPHLPLFVLFLLSVSMMLAFAPFEAPKSKRELAGGVYAEYGGILYLFLIAAERIFVLVFAVAGAVLFLGGTEMPFGLDFIGSSAGLAIKTVLMLFLMALAKAVLPSYKTDQMMRLCFMRFLPFSLVWMMGSAVVVLSCTGDWG